MKHLLAFIVLIGSTSCRLADEPGKRLVQFDKTETIEQALSYFPAPRPGCISHHYAYPG